MDEGGLKAAVAGQIRVGAHGWKSLHDDALDIDAVRLSITLNGKIIEDYLDDMRGPSALVLSFFRMAVLYTAYGLGAAKLTSHFSSQSIVLMLAVGLLISAFASHRQCGTMS